MGNPPFEDVSPIEQGSFPLLCWFTRGYVKFPGSNQSYESPKFHQTWRGTPGWSGSNSVPLQSLRVEEAGHEKLAI